jgi:hypothetical protein
VGWTPLAAEYPPPNTRVLVACPAGTGHSLHVSRHDDAGVFFSDEGFSPRFPVYWMPLPPEPGTPEPVAPVLAAIIPRRTPHEGDPMFGVDPEDSIALGELRAAIDANLEFPSTQADEDGDYVGAVRHTRALVDQLRERLAAHLPCPVCVGTGCGQYPEPCPQASCAAARSKRPPPVGQTGCCEKCGGGGTRAPIGLVLHCPACGMQHIDGGKWSAHPHKTHLCLACQHEWRPFRYPTVGIYADSIAIPAPAPDPLENLSGD